MRGLWCYRGGYILSAVPLRLDNQFIFHSVSATNCLQNYNFSMNLQEGVDKNNLFAKQQVLISNKTLSLSLQKTRALYGTSP